MSKLNSRGFTLVEVIIVIAILTVLMTIIVPSSIEYLEKSKQEVCNINRLQLEKMYDIDITLENIEHSETVFAQYLKEYEGNICPKHGDISYLNGRVQCSVHNSGEKDSDVPFL